MTEKVLVSPQVISMLKLFVSLVPDKKVKSEKPTLVKSEYKKARERNIIPSNPISIWRILLNDKYILSSSIK